MAMTSLLATFLLIVIGIGILSRRPFLHFPLDDDFSLYTYIARFSRRGLRWKHDLQVIGIPIWKMRLIDRLYGSPEGGIQRVRHLQTAFHCAGSAVIFIGIWQWTQDPWAALAGGTLHAFYGTSPDLTAGSFNHEQFYVPVIFAGLLFLCAGPWGVPWAGFCFGIATFAKTNVGLYPAVFLWPIGSHYGLPAMGAFAAAGAAPMLLSHLVERANGYWDPEAKRQMAARYATTIRSTRTKGMYFSVAREVGGLIRQTLPLWIAGLPGLALSFYEAGAVWMGGFTLATVGMIVFQRAFSRYHYLPLLGLLAFSSGIALHSLYAWDPQWGLAGIAALGAITLWNVKSLQFYYSRPTAPETLVRYEKFDQYLYLPRLGKLMKRIMRARGESEERIYVWGTFTQLYHLTECPSSDTYLHYCIGPWNRPALEIYFDTVVGGWMRHRPPYLVQAFHDLDLDALKELTGLDYRLIKVFYARFPVFRLMAQTSVARDPLSLTWQEKMQWMERLTSGGKHIPGVDRTEFTPERLRTAYKECHKLVRMNPNDIEGLIYLGEIYNQMERFDDSANALSLVIGKEPHRSYIRILLAATRLNQSMTDEAERLLDEEKRRFSKVLEPAAFAEIAFLRGRIAQDRHDFPSAVETFKGIVREYPNRAEAWQRSIQCLASLNEMESIHRLFDETVRIENRKEAEWVRTLIAKAVAEGSAPEKPEHETLDEYSRQDSGNTLLAYALASALEKGGKAGEAFRRFERIAKTEPGYSDIRGAAWFRAARLAPQELKEDFCRQCLELIPNHNGARKILNEMERTHEIFHN